MQEVIRGFKIKDKILENEAWAKKKFKVAFETFLLLAIFFWSEIYYILSLTLISFILSGSVSITVSGSILVDWNLCFRVFKIQSKIISKNVYLYSVWVNQIKVTLLLVALYLF